MPLSTLTRGVAKGLAIVAADYRGVNVHVIKTVSYLKLWRGRGHYGGSQVFSDCHYLRVGGIVPVHKVPP